MTDQLDVTESYLALRRTAAAFELPRDVLAVRGSDAISFLQGQLSADVAALAVGEHAWSLLLQPQGKVVAWLRVSRTAEDEVVLDVDAGSGPAVVERLERFKLRIDATIDALEWRCIGVRGPDAASVDLSDVDAAVTAAVDWRGLPGVDLLGPAVEPPASLPVAHDVAVHNVRIEQGWPTMGHELDESVIPGEAGQWLVDTSVSFTKGCYTGQELVARIDSRGNNTPRRLRGLVLGANVLPPVGAEIVVDGEVRGQLTSVGESLDLRAPVALGLVHRSVDVPATAVVRWSGGDGAPGGEAPAQVRDLPLSQEPRSPESLAG